MNEYDTHDQIKVPLLPKSIREEAVLFCISSLYTERDDNGTVTTLLIVKQLYRFLLIVIIAIPFFLLFAMFSRL
ncbi:hypothetical protein [Paenibacillus hunanensis]|uniref:hypothetical protein n=1 Tax=Paenibacillus hunanensis TaxID=539262 RepID=UPI0019B91ED8|nr:hypothetical protein [Paenibacillus hunanensis]GGJ20270.1 hypothetical protein GCM10008022_31720 [Paenibacillus hunanensis]